MGSRYVLGHSDAEQGRLIRQATLLESITKRRLVDSGIGAGHQVLDVGCGAGDVSMLAARLVGLSGHVVGVDSDAATIALARERALAQGVRNVTFVHEELERLSVDRLFDAVVGRLVLKHISEPTAALRRMRSFVRPKGIILCQEGCWSPMMAVGSRLPLWTRLLTTLRDIFICSGLNPDGALELYSAFQDADLGPPVMHMDIPLSGDCFIADIEVDLLGTLLHVAREHGVSLADLGDPNTLADRIHAERQEHRAVIAFLGIVSAWARVPDADVAH